jgi:hypothetical protein
MFFDFMVNTTIMCVDRAKPSAQHLILRKEDILRFLLISLCTLILFLSSNALAQTPPLKFITISGNTDTKFNKVSLFEGGASVEPLKTQEISEYSGGQYSINVDIPADMKKKENYYFTDMRFWNDKNQNGSKDSNEPASECHFIMWVPALNKIYMQVYEGEKYPIEYSNFYYQYRSK